LKRNTASEAFTFAPMNFLSVENLTKYFGERLIFEDVSFGLNEGDKVALVARNGTGKSTLLRILASEMSADSGRVVFNKDITVGYLSQDHGLKDELTILENLFASGNALTEAVRAYEAALDAGGQGPEMEKAMELMDRQNAWDYESKARQILGKLNLHQLNRPVEKLSGGEKRRVGLARVLIAEPDLLLLDEPTNHLDLDMTEWLEEFLSRSRCTLLMVTHDRYFLEVVCDEILEIDHGKMYRYRGSFSYFLEKKAERDAERSANLDRARNLMRRELEWIRRSPKARTTKSKSRVDRFDDVKSAASQRWDEDEMKLEINIERLGSKTVEMHRVKKSWPGVNVLNGFDYVFQRGEKVGLAGRNGTGKTTFLNMITGKEEPDGGKVTVGDTVIFGYYTQEGLNFTEEQKVIDVVRAIADFIPLAKGQKITAAQMLERFMFERHQHHDYVAKLSGGERRRLHLLTVLMKNPNFLILDEPTNDLDIYAMAALEDYLVQYPGCLLVVSHDRYFLDKVVDHILVLNGTGEVKDIIGNYTKWREDEKAKSLEKKPEPQTSEPKRKAADSKPKTKLSFKEREELANLEALIPKLEARKIELETALSSGDISGHEELLGMTNELAEIAGQIDRASDRWLELSEFAG
jgi:ABC transport system ATP-binding/permease protein